MGFRIVHGSPDIDRIAYGRAVAVYVIGSTMTSTIPGISLAGSMPIATLFTPALDVEYLFYGRPVSLDIVPTTPTGIPTPAIITRVSLQLSKTPFLVVNAGSYIEPAIPRIDLPSKTVGRRIDVEDALPRGTSRRLFEEASSIGYALGSVADIVLVGESIPAGTTTAMSILLGLGYNAYSIVSSSSKDNPLELKRRVVEKAVRRLRGGEDPFTINDIVGDPLHISVAGIALGALRAEALVVLAGGTQMLAALALMKAIEQLFKQSNVILATTRWIYRDRGREIVDFVKENTPGIAVVYTDIGFEDAPSDGLRAYEEGYVKEGVGAGGTAFLAIARGVDAATLKKGIYLEYERITRGVASDS